MNMKKIIVFFMSLCISWACCCSTGAIDTAPSVNNEEQTQNNQAVNTDDIAHQIIEIMQNYSDNPEETESALANIGVTLLDEPQVISFGAESQARGLDPTDYTLSIFSARRAGDMHTYLMWSLHANKTELFPGPLDLISMEWDTSRASYYLSEGDGVYSTVQARAEGIVLFNVQDNDLDKDEYASGYVIVTPHKLGWMEYGSKYVHTYSKYLWGGSVSYSFAPSATVSANGDWSLNLAHTMGFTATISSTTEMWQIWTDNAVDIQ